MAPVNGGFILHDKTVNGKLLPFAIYEGNSIFAFFVSFQLSIISLNGGLTWTVAMTGDVCNMQEIDKIQQEAI